MPPPPLLFPIDVSEWVRPQWLWPAGMLFLLVGAALMALSFNLNRDLFGWIPGLGWHPARARASRLVFDLGLLLTAVGAVLVVAAVGE